GPTGPAAASPSESAAVPKKTVKNQAFSTVTLIACIAATASAGGRRASAAMTKVEKAKKMPATSPAPSAASSVAQRRMELPIAIRASHRAAHRDSNDRTRPRVPHDRQEPPPLLDQADSDGRRHGE